MKPAIIAVTALTLLLAALTLLPSSPTPNLTDPNDFECGLTVDFVSFLNSNGYSQYNFNRTDIRCGSFGGKLYPFQTIDHTPVIFIHDNQDIAYGRGTADGHQSWQTGFRQYITYLQQNKFQQSEIYTTTWGHGNPANSTSNYHSYAYLSYIRKFIEAVLSYTNAKQVNVVAHGMGVTLVRKAMKGGYGNDHVTGYYDLGASLKNYVKTFIALAGYNYGLNNCAVANITTFCGNKDGFFPGTIVGGLAEFLDNLNTQGGLEANYIYVAYSNTDEKIGVGSKVFNQVTCRIPGQNGEQHYTDLGWNHDYIRDHSMPDMIKFLL